MNKLYLLCVMCLSCLISCTDQTVHNHDTEDHDHELEAPHGHDEHSHTNPEKTLSNLIHLSSEKAESAGIRTEKIVPGNFSEVIKTSGQILAAQGEETTIVASATGVVKYDKRITEGMKVSAKSELLILSSENLMNGSEAKRVKIAYETARKEYERASKLVADQIVSQREFETLKENYENARIAYEALSIEKNGNGVSVKSPTDGYIKNCLVNEGDYVTVGQPLMSVTKTRRLQLRAEVSERYYGQLRHIVSANFSTTYNNKMYALKDMHGKLLAYGKSSEKASYYIPVTFEFDNVGDIIPGSFVETYLLGAERNNVISVPVSALIEEQGLFFVFVRVNDEDYVRREVKPGTHNGQRIEILSGINEGELIVTSGAIHVKLASASNSIPGHTHNH